jgi:hypothetical protein
MSDYGRLSPQFQFSLSAAALSVYLYVYTYETAIIFKDEDELLHQRHLLSSSGSTHTTPRKAALLADQFRYRSF